MTISRNVLHLQQLDLSRLAALIAEKPSQKPWFL